MIEEKLFRKLLYYAGWFILIFANPFLCWIIFQVYKKENKLNHFSKISRLDRVDFQNLAIIAFGVLVAFFVIYVGKDKSDKPKNKSSTSFKDDWYMRDE